MKSSRLAKAISQTFLVAGGLIFFFGDRALREIWKMNFVLAELLGIGGGLSLMFLGAAIRFAATKSTGTPEKQDLH